ncbi:MAG: hypothetical protein KGO53_14325 [Alphaproteobacteria bacterium]|nr:hypothetical protein [Alphaproteobacteria bacterium]
MKLFDDLILPTPVIPAQAGICVFSRENRDARFRGHDGRGNVAQTYNRKPTRRAFRPFFHPRILIGAKPGRNFPSIFLHTGGALMR